MNKAVKVFCGGSIKIQTLPDEAKESLSRIMEQGFTVLVGDAPGVDSLIQKYLIDHEYENVVVYHMSRKMRYCLDKEWVKKPVANTGGRTAFTAKDVVMSGDCDYGLFVWDGASKGTAENMDRLKSMSKQFRLFRV